MTTERLPKILRRRLAVEATYSFCGYPLRDGMAEEWPPNVPIRDERDGTYINRERTTNYVGVPRRKP